MEGEASTAVDAQAELKGQRREPQPGDKSKAAPIYLYCKTKGLEEFHKDRSQHCRNSILLN